MSDVAVKYNGRTIAELNDTGGAVLKAKNEKLKTDVRIDYKKRPWNYLGADAELISNFSVFSVALINTEFDMWTPSTTAKAILATETFGTFAADIKNYDYVIKWTFWTDLKYNAGATMKAMPYKQRSIALNQLYRRPRYYSDFQAENYNYTIAGPADLNTGAILYYNSSGNMAVANVTGYGFYATLQTPTLSSATSNTPTVTIPRPILYARCNSTYMATARASEIDKTNSKLYLRCEVYRVKKDYSRNAEMKEIVEAMIA